MTLITTWTVSCRSEGCRTWSRADNKKLSTIILSWVVFCVWKFNRNFIRATAKAAFIFFFSLPFSSKRAWESEAYFLEKPLVKSEIVDCQINESQKLFVMGSFQFLFVVVLTALLLVLVHALCFFAFAKTNRLPFLDISCELFSAVWSVLRDDNLIQLIGFDIVELLQT